MDLPSIESMPEKPDLPAACIAPLIASESLLIPTTAATEPRVASTFGQLAITQVPSGLSCPSQKVRTAKAARSMNPGNPELVTSPSNATHAFLNARTPPIASFTTVPNPDEGSRPRAFTRSGVIQSVARTFLNAPMRSPTALTAPTRRLLNASTSGFTASVAASIPTVKLLNMGPISGKTPSSMAAPKRPRAAFIFANAPAVVFPDSSAAPPTFFSMAAANVSNDTLPSEPSFIACSVVTPICSATISQTGTPEATSCIASSP